MSTETEAAYWTGLERGIALKRCWLFTAAFFGFMAGMMFGALLARLMT